MEKELEFMLNKLLNDAICKPSRIKNKNSNEVAKFVTAWMVINKNDLLHVVNGSASVNIMDGELITYCGYTQSNRNKLEIMVHGEENYIGNNLKEGDKVEIRHYR